MNDLAIPILLVLAIFALERVGVTGATRSAAGCRWILRHPWVHPNAICLARIPMGLVSILVWELAGPTAAFVWVAIWMISDLTDGTIARNCDLVTERGKWLDPLSDKCMVLPPLLFLALAPGVTVPPPLGVSLAFVVVDVVGQLSRLFVERTSANLFGKGKTGLVTVLLGVITLHQIAPLPEVTPQTVAAMATLCLVLGVLSAAGKTLPRRTYAALLVTGAAVCLLFAALSLLREHLVATALWLALPFAMKLLDEDFAIPACLGCSTTGSFARFETRFWWQTPKTARVTIILVLLIGGCFAAAHAHP